MTKTEIENFDLGAHFRNLCKEPEKRSYSVMQDISNSLANEQMREGFTPNGSMIPGAVLARQLTVNVGSAGGFLVSQDDVGTFVDALRPASVCIRLGADTVTGLRANLTEPVQTSTSSTQWIGESTSGNVGSITFGALNLTPHTLVTQLHYTRQLLAQTNGRIAQIVSNDLRRVFGTALDAAALTGPGGASPAGIIYTPGISTITFGGPASQTALAAMEAAVATANGEGPAAGWATSPLVRQKFRVLPENGTGSREVWRDGKILDYPAYSTTNLSGSNRLIYSGSWDNLLLAFWGGDAVDLLVDPFTQAQNGIIICTATMYADVGLKQPAAFIASVDAANQ